MSYHLQLQKIFFSNVSYEKKVEFGELLKRSIPDLCIHKNMNLQGFLEESFEWLCHPEYIHDSPSNDFILYIVMNNESDMRKIVALAYCIKEGRNKIILELLCGYRNKALKMNNTTLGRVLLSNLYNTYVIKYNKVFMIKPAGKELINYYKRWKKPSLELSIREYTSGVLLVYGNVYLLEENDMRFLINFDNLFFIKKNLHITDELNDLTHDETKNYLIDKTQSSDLNDIEKIKQNKIIQKMKYVKISDLEIFEDEELPITSSVKTRTRSYNSTSPKTMSGGRKYTIKTKYK